jgi:hypothetical protein
MRDYILSLRMTTRRSIECCAIAIPGSFQTIVKVYGRLNHRSASNSSAVGLSLGSSCIVLQMKSLSSYVTSLSCTR